MANNASDSFLKGISVQTIVSLANAIIQIVVFAILSRLMSKSEFGYYAALQGVTFIFMCISDAGIGSAVIQQKNPSERYISSAFTLSILCGVLIGLPFLLLAPVMAPLILDDTLTFPMMLMSIPLLFHSINGFAVGCLRRELKFGTQGICKMISYTISAGVAIYIAYRGGGLDALLTLFILDSIIYTMLVFANIRIPRIGWGKAEAKSILSFGGWLTMGGIMSSIANQVDKLVLGKWLTVEKLGAYNRPAGFISNIIGQLNTIFDGVLFPILSGFQDSKEKFRNILYRSYGLLSTLGVLLASMLFFNSRLIIDIFFGNEWVDLFPVLRIAALSAIFMLNNTLADCFFRSFNLVRQGFFIRLFGLILALVLLYVGAQYDIIGVALSVFISNLVIVILKIAYLSIKSEASAMDMAKISLRAWVPSLPIIFVGIAFESMPSTAVVLSLEMLLTLAVLFVELLRFPQFVGTEYNNLIYSKVYQIKSSILRRAI